MAVLGFTAKLEVDDGAADAFAKFAGVVQLSLPEQEVGEEEITELGQVDGSAQPDPVRRWMPTLIDAGMIEGTGFFTKAEYVRLRALLGKAKNFKLTAPDDDGAGANTAGVCTGPGFLKKLGKAEFEIDKSVKVAFSIRMSKAWSLT